MSAASSRSVIRLHERVLRNGADACVNAAVMHDGAWRWAGAVVGLDGARVHRAQAGIRAQGSERGDLRPARPADAPGLLEDAAAPAPVAVAPVHRIVVPPRGKQA